MKTFLICSLACATLLCCGEKNSAPENEPLVVSGHTPSTPPAVKPNAAPAPKANPHGNAVNPHGNAVNPHRGMPQGHPAVPSGRPPVANPHAGPKQLPAGHPPVAPRAGQATNPRRVANANALPLRETGPGGAKELARVEVQFEEGADRELFQGAFKSVFTPNRQQRDPVQATRDLRSLTKKYPNAAPLYRVMGYAAVDNGFQTQLAFRMYNKAVELDPDYGEVHYALAFLYVMSDKATGGAHYKMALKLGVEDQRGIGQRFYPHLVQ